jgi:hypothetical protein
MPYYEYYCPANGRTLEVRHAMEERIETWGELVRRAGADPSDTPSDAPVERLISAPVPLTEGDAAASDFQGCGRGCACVPQA